MAFPPNFSLRGVPSMAIILLSMAFLIHHVHADQSGAEDIVHVVDGAKNARAAEFGGSLSRRTTAS